VGQPPPARLIDLTRLVSRLDRGAPTGIDRVELAYLRHFAEDDVPCFALTSTPLGVLLLDRAGARHVLARATGAAVAGPGDLIGRLTRRAQPGRGRDEADLRRMALARSPRPGLAATLRRHLPPGTDCFLVGHSDLAEPMLQALKRGGGGRVVVLLHDTIPLDHPGLARPGTPARFAAQVRAVASGADLVVFASAEAAARAVPHLAGFGRLPPHLVAPLGVGGACPDPAALPPDLCADGRPLFLALGTIEPRKNHTLLLDIWERLHASLAASRIPRLVVAGARGWANAAVFRRLDSRPFVGRTVVEHAGLSDGAVAALMDRSAALLFPSLAEGFGLPPAEAAARGLPVIAAPLPALRETLGDYPTYLQTDDPLAWMRAILARAEAAGRTPPAPRPPLAVPTWADHFNLVLNPAC
jgi:glycosyltransferase involved in cell wall biosynthesis